MTTDTNEATGADLLNRTRAWKHPDADTCPVCGDPVRTVAVVNLVYTFEVCSCSQATYEHLRERLWHRTCFPAIPCMTFRPFHVRGVRGRPAHDTPECIDCGRTESSHSAVSSAVKDGTDG